MALGLFASLAALPALADARSLDDSNRAFAEGRYEEAERALEALVREEGFAPGVLGNLGNAHLEQGELGEAILAYERARRLDPHDAKIAQNLRVARARAEVPAPPEGRVESVAAILSAHAWRALGAASLILFVLGCAGAGLLRRGRGASVGVSIASGVVVLACGVAVGVHALDVDRAVVVEGPVTARVSPFDEAEAVFELREGATVPVRASHGAFVRVEREDGTTGWTPARAVELIVPRR